MPDTLSRQDENKGRRKGQNRMSGRPAPSTPKLSPEKRKMLLEDAERHIEANREVYEGLARE